MVASTLNGSAQETCMTTTAHASFSPVHPSHPDHGAEPTGATRHLCTGVHIDESFRNLVLKEVCTAFARRTAPSYGFDLVPVMRHAWLALHLSTLSRLVLIAALITPYLGGLTVATLLIIGGYVLLVLLERAWRISKDLARPEERSEERRVGKECRCRQWSVRHKKEG